MRFALLAAILFLLGVGGARTATAAADDSLSTLRSLGVQIKAAVDQEDFGHSVDKIHLQRLEHQLRMLQSAAVREHDTAQARKIQSIALLFGELSQKSSHPQSFASNARPSTRSNVDVEVVSKRHGASCATALGITNSLPVSVTLATPGKGQSDVWFRYSPDTADGGVRFVTDSSGMDPALAVYANCDASARTLAADDDALGLDAAVALATVHQTPLLVHLSNSGNAGAVVLSAMAANGSLSGHITTAGTNQPVTSASINLFNTQSGYSVTGTAYTDQSGIYAFPALAAGTYYVRVDASGYVSQLYPSAECLPSSYMYSMIGCNTASAQTVTVTSGNATTDIDMVLGSGQTISGQVQDIANQPVSAYVQLFNADGSSLLSTFSDINGQYAFTTLPVGSYKLQASSDNHVSQMFDHVACAGDLQTQCDLTNAVVVNVTNADISDVNFSLQELASIHGTVTYDVAPPNPYATELIVENIDTHLDMTAATDANGNFTFGPLAIGTYQIYANPTGYFSQVYGGTDCASPTCDAELPNSMTIAITAFGQQAVAGFSLHSLPTVSGHVQDAASGLPLANVSILASDSPPLNFVTTGSATTDQNGNYTLVDLPAGRYYLWATSPDHGDQIFDGILCENFGTPFSFYPRATCNVSSATLLTIAPGQTPGVFDFSLVRSGRITGTARVNAGPNSDIPAVNAAVTIYDGTGASIAAAGTDTFGNYVVNDLPAGAYYAAVISSSSYANQIWRNQTCAYACYPTTGTAINVQTGASAGGIDFSLIDLAAVVGRVTDSDGVPLSGSAVDLFSAQNGSYSTSGIVDSQGFFLAHGSISSNYLVATDAGPSHVDQVYSGISCPLGAAYYGLCPLDQAVPVSLSYSDTQPHIVNFVLQQKDEIFANGFE